MQLTVGLLFMALVLFAGIAVQRFLQQRRHCLLQSKIIASANCCVAVTDATAPRHPIVYVNPAFRLMTGYAESDLLGQTMAILAGPETDRTSLDKLAVALQDGRAGRICLRHYRKNGTPFWNEITLSPFKDRTGRVTSVVWVMADVTQRRQEEREVRESEERFDLAVQAAQVGIFEHDHRTDTMYWSPILRDIVGVSPDEPASLQRYVELIHRSDRDRMLQAIHQAHDPSGDGRCHVEHQLVRPDGNVRHLSLRSLTWFDEEGAARLPSRTLGMVIDITDRTIVDADRRDTSKMEAIGTLAGGIAHEFNNSLTAVLGFSQLALPLIPSDSKAHRHIEQVVAAGQKSRALVHQLLTFSQQSGQVRRPLSLHLLVRESLKLLRPTIPSWIEFKAHIANSVSLVSADATQMHQLILNLVENAVHAMHRTGGTLDIRLEDKEFSGDHVMPHGRIAAGCYTCLSVQDSGEGMDQDVADRAFEPFFTTKSLGGGRGMGLPVVHGIVSAHGGTVLVNSHPGLGTTVSVYLPILQASGSSLPPQDEPPPRGHECILFVDDEESLARLGGEMLESLGYYPVVRTSATAAWEAFQAAPQRVDLLIADQSMPGMTGDRLIQRCRRIRADLPVILCTGSEQQLSEEDARSHGIAEFILKPLMLNDLAHRIRRILDRPIPPASVPSGSAQSTTQSEVSSEELDAIGSRR
jgi:PAS domain S-box-containing protein